MREKEVIERLRRIATSPEARGLLDDVAVLGRLVVTHDTIAEHVHFLSSDPAASVGWKLVAVNLSDLAADPRQQIGIHPVDHEPIRREQLQRAGTLQNLQRTYPRIELLLWKLGFQSGNALSPMRRFHALPPRPPRRDLRKGLRSLYLVQRVLKP